MLYAEISWTLFQNPCAMTKKEMETLHDYFFVHFVLLPAGEKSHRRFSLLTFPVQVQGQCIQDSFFPISDTSHEKISTATAGHQKN